MSELQTSGIFAARVIEDIQAKAESGLYAMRGFGTLRERRWATFDDLTFLPCSLTRIPLEGYRERCLTKTVLGTRHAKRPVELEIPITVAGMSFGALSATAKEASSVRSWRRARAMLSGSSCWPAPPPPASERS